MTPALLIMAAIGVVIGTTGGVYLLRSRHAGGASAVYLRRLSGSMLLAIGLILIAFATVYAAAIR